MAEGGRGFASGAGIRVRLLGRFAVLRGAEEIPLRAFGGRRAQQLLRLLALRRGTLVPKDVIAEALWPKRRPADAAGNTEVLVSRIRRALGDRTLIQTGPGGYSLTADSRCWVDAEAFAAAVSDGRALLAARPAEALVSFRSALDIWQGEPLAEDTYEDWAAADRRRLTLALLEALDGAAAAALACGYPGEALTWAERALASEPLREASAMLAVRALAASGGQAGALTAFDLFQRRLAREMGLDPSPDAQELRQRVLRGEPLPPGLGNVPTGRCTRPLSAEPFAGRDEECTAILAAAAGRGPRLILVTGPRGVGKSRLLAEAARRVRVPVLDCQAFAPDRDEAWIARLFAGHVVKENDVLLPALLAAMHHRTEQAAPVNPAEAAIAADPLGTVLSLLLQAATALARAGQADQAGRLAAAAWAALREPRPDLAVRVTAALHGLARRADGAAGQASSAGGPPGAQAPAGEPDLDVRDLPPARRHGSIFAAYQTLAPGAGFVLVNDHDPKPLRHQFEAEHADQFTWDYREAGPQTWRVRIGRPLVVTPSWDGKADSGGIGRRR